MDASPGFPAKYMPACSLAIIKRQKASRSTLSSPLATLSQLGPPRELLLVTTVSTAVSLPGSSLETRGKHWRTYFDVQQNHHRVENEALHLDSILSGEM